MSIHYLTESEAAAVKPKHSYNDLYNLFFKPVVEGAAPGISFMATDYGYVSSVSAERSLRAAIKRLRLPLRTLYRGDTVYVIRRDD